MRIKRCIDDDDDRCHNWYSSPIFFPCKDGHFRKHAVLRFYVPPMKDNNFDNSTVLLQGFAFLSFVHQSVFQSSVLYIRSFPILCSSMHNKSFSCIGINHSVDYSPVLSIVLTHLIVLQLQFFAFPFWFLFHIDIYEYLTFSIEHLVWCLDNHCVFKVMLRTRREWKISLYTLIVGRASIICNSHWHMWNDTKSLAKLSYSLLYSSLFSVNSIISSACPIISSTDPLIIKHGYVSCPLVIIIQPTIGQVHETRDDLMIILDWIIDRRSVWKTIWNWERYVQYDEWRDSCNSTGKSQGSIVSFNQSSIRQSIIDQWWERWHWTTCIARSISLIC